MRSRVVVVIAVCACGDDGGSAKVDAPAIDARVIDAVAIDTRSAGECWVFSGGTGGASYMEGTGGATGTARFNFPQGIAVDSTGNFYVGDFGNHRVRKLAPDGSTTTLAGTGVQGFGDGAGSAALFSGPAGVATDAAGNTYVSDFFTHRIRKIAPDGTTTTLAGNGMGGFVDGTGGPTGTTQFMYPNHLTVDSNGNVYVISQSRVRKVAPDGATTTLAGNGTQGYMDGTGGATGTAQFGFGGESIGGLTTDSVGNVYVADYYNHRIRKIAADGTTTTLAGSDTQATTDGTGTSAAFAFPFGLTMAPDGALYVAQFGTPKIRRVTLGGVVTTIDGMCSNGEFRGIAVRNSVAHVAAGSVAVILAIQLP